MGGAAVDPFVYGDLQLNKTEVNIFEEVIISVMVTNTGSVASRGEVFLRVDDQVSSMHDFGPLKPGAVERVHFTLRFTEKGKHLVTLAELAPVSIRVVEKARITLRRFTATPLKLDANQEGNVSVEAFNFSLLTGPIVIQFKIDGQVQQSISPELTPGQTLLINFPFRFEDRDRGWHELSVNDLPPIRIFVKAPLVQTIPEVFDENGNLSIDDAEILKAVGFWITRLEVPQTQGQRVTDERIIELIQLWSEGALLIPSP